MKPTLVMDDLTLFCCQYPDCLDYGKRDYGNLTVCGYYGTQQRRLLYCKSCKARVSERKRYSSVRLPLGGGQSPRPTHPYRRGLRRPQD